MSSPSAPSDRRQVKDQAQDRAIDAAQTASPATTASASAPAPDRPLPVLPSGRKAPAEAQEPWSWRREWRFALGLAAFFGTVLLGPLLLVWVLVRAEKNGAVDWLTELGVRYVPPLARLLQAGAEGGSSAPAEGMGGYDPLVGLHDEL